MERSEAIKRIKELAIQANLAITQKDFGFVYVTYLKIAELCKEIGDLKNASLYIEDGFIWEQLNLTSVSYNQSGFSYFNFTLNTTKYPDNNEYRLIAEVTSKAGFKGNATLTNITFVNEYVNISEFPF